MTYCDRHEIHAGEKVEAEHEITVGNNLWRLCDDCRDSLHNWFGTYPNEHDRVNRHEAINEINLRDRL